MKNLKISVLVLLAGYLSGCVTTSGSSSKNDINKSSNNTPTVEVAPAPPEIAPAPPQAISQFDTMTRQFTISELDLLPIPNSTRPSAVILFNKGVNVAKNNKAFCEGFIQLPTPTEVDNIRIEDQVVTKLPVNKEISQDVDNCDEILAVYDYDLAKKKLIEINPILQNSYGPFIAIYEPNSIKVSQIIDLRGNSPEKLTAFGKSWHTIFMTTANNTVAGKGTSDTFSKTLDFMVTFKKFFKASVCITDPNLIYIFHEGAGRLADMICKSNNV